MGKDSKKRLSLLAPMSGVLIEIEKVPDPVFAAKMVGDGISIDPISNLLVAPCDGEVTQVHSSHHAVTVLSEVGAEVMMHIGIDTVGLKGEGFDIKVKEGDKVKANDPLIEFDMDFVAQKAKSLLTQVVITNGENVSLKKYSGVVNSGENKILELTIDSSNATADSDLDSFEAITSEVITIMNPVGLHARPSAILSSTAKKFKSAIEISSNGKKANARSTTALMKMEIGNADEVVLVARGEDAEVAIAELTELIKSGLGEDVAQQVEVVEIIEDDVYDEPISDNPNELIGIGASPGIAIGTLFKLKDEELEVKETTDKSADDELKLLNSSIVKSVKNLEKLISESESSESEIFEAHIELLSDPELIDSAKDAIMSGKAAAYAWQQAYTNQADSLSKLKSELLAGRANDLRDIGLSTLKLIMGIDDSDLEIPENSILIADDLTPSQTAKLDRNRVLGFCTIQGGASSHVAILARSLDIPAIAGIECRAMKLDDGVKIIIDGTKGIAEVNLSDERIAEIKAEQEKQAVKKAEDDANCMKDAVTTDGKKILLVGNAGCLSDVEQAVEKGGEGIGLLRSEFLFQNRNSAPTEDEQEDVYASMAKTLGNDRTIVIRTLDVGGDKPLPYLPIPKEENPFLGERGIRVSLARPEILRTQFRAILKASKSGSIDVMFPMVSSLSEFREAKKIFQEEADKLGVELPKTGIMVEVPVVAAMAEQFAKEVDFFSVGTNDLAQYTMAVDRGHPKLAHLADGLNPGMLSLIANAANAIHKYGKTISVCGGIASDFYAVPVLVGLGIDKLSASVPSIPAVKAQVRELSLEDCKELAQKALEAESAVEVKKLVDQFYSK
jgi:phosphocarrier protein FPr